MPGKKALIADVVDTAQKLKREVKKIFHMTFYRHQPSGRKKRERLPSVHQCQGKK